MKTPKRNYVSAGGDVYDCITARKANKFARWKRKNRVKQLKRTIARLKKQTIDNYLHGYNAGCRDAANARVNGVRPDSLCATCKHLQKTASGFKFCEHRRSEKYDCVCIDRGFKRCQAYERKDNQQ